MEPSTKFVLAIIGELIESKEVKMVKKVISCDVSSFFILHLPNN